MMYMLLTLPQIMINGIKANLVGVVWLESKTQCVTKREWQGFKWERL